MLKVSKTAECVIGIDIAPMIIFRRKNDCRQNYMTVCFLAEKSAKSNMTNALFKEFLSAQKSLLISDDAACHLGLSIVEAADSLDISLYCLPSNTTHKLQALDKVVDRSFEHQ